MMWKNVTQGTQTETCSCHLYVLYYSQTPATIEAFVKRRVCMGLMFTSGSNVRSILSGSMIHSSRGPILNACPYLALVQSLSFIPHSFIIEMNLLKRLFSIGTKKSKKKRTQIVHNVPLPEHDWSKLQATEDHEHEAAVGRLLRSSSARYAETPEPCYANLPPLRKELHNAF